MHYLSGEIPQGRFGIGYATLRKASEQERGRVDGDADDRATSTEAWPRSPPCAAPAPRPGGPRHCSALFARADARRAGIPDPPAGRRAAPGRARRRHGRCNRVSGRRTGGTNPPCGDVCQESRRGRARGAHRGRRIARAISARAVVADRSDAGADRGRRRRSAGAARRRGRVRMEDGRRAHPAAQGRRRRAHLHAQLERGDGRGAGDRRDRARACRRAK